MAGYSVTFTVVDQATKQINDINKRITQMRAPLEANAKAMAKFFDTSGLKAVSDGLKTVAGSAVSAAESIGLMVPGLTAITGGAILAGIGKLITDFANWNQELTKTADWLDESPEQLAQFQQAVRLAGGDVADMTGALKELKATSYDAFMGFNAVAATTFARAGIAIRDFNGKLINSDQLLPQVIHWLDHFTNSEDRRREAMRLGGQALANLDEDFRASGKTIDDWIAQSNKMQVITEGDRKAYQQYSLAIAELQSAFYRLGVQVGGTLATAITPMIQQFGVWMQDNQQQVTDGVLGLAQAFVQLGKDVRDIYGVMQDFNAFFKPVSDFLDGLQDKVNQLGHDMGTVFRHIFGLPELPVPEADTAPGHYGAGDRQWTATIPPAPGKPGQPGAKAPPGTVTPPAPAARAPGQPVAPTPPSVTPGGVNPPAAAAAPAPAAAPAAAAGPASLYVPAATTISIYAPNATQITGLTGMGGGGGGGGGGTGMGGGAGAGAAPGYMAPGGGSMGGQVGPGRVPGTATAPTPAMPAPGGGEAVPGAAGQWYTGHAAAHIAEHGGFNFAGIRAKEGGFRTYPSEFAGVADAARLLSSKTYAGGGVNTMRGIINKWAPPSENNTAQLLQRAQKIMGNIDAPLNMRDPGTLTKVLDVMQQNEFGGKSPVPMDRLTGYVQRFLGGEGPTQLAGRGPMPGVDAPSPPNTPGGGAAGNVVDQMVAMAGTRGAAVREFLRDPSGKIARDPDLGLWCAEFTNAALQHMGVPGTKGPSRLMAASFAQWGQQVKADELQKGDVLLNFNRKHVGVATGRTWLNTPGHRPGEVEEVSSNSIVNGVLTNLPGTRWRSDVEVRRSHELALAQAKGAPGTVMAGGKGGTMPNGNVNVTVTHRNPPAGSTIDAGSTGQGLTVPAPRIEHQQFGTA